MKGKFQILTSEYPYALRSFVRSAVSFRSSLAVVPTAIVLALVILLTALPAIAQSVVKKTVLPNGLKVLTKEIHATPVVSFNIWYKVGSRNEQLGKTGLSHLLEHMQFKGTKSLKKGEIDKLIRQNGGLSNAATWKDFTYYWQTLSSDKLELAMRIE
ncbi:MAG: M16 family metallopeptidase, partial [Armatimonadota bacterium]